MADEQIRISIGAVENASLDRVFGNVRRKALKNAQDVSQAFKRGTADWANAHAKVKSAAASAAASVAKSARQSANEESRAAKHAAKEKASAEKAWSSEFERESKRRLRFSQMEFRQRQREHRASLKAQLAEERRVQSESVRAARRSENIRQRDASRLSHRATRFFWPNMPVMSMGRRVVGDFARGVGVDTSIASQIQNRVEARETAAYLSNVAARPDGSRRSTEDYVGMGSNLAGKYGVKGGVNAVMEGAQRFFAQRGNMGGFEALSDDLAKRSVAYKTNFGDLSHTAAKFDSALGNIDQFKNDDAARYQAIMGLIDNAIAQGNVGSIEIEDLAKEIPKLSGIAGMVGGDIGTNLKELIAIAQLAERGPAKNAATAGTFTQNFALDLPKRAQAFKDIAGINLFDEAGNLKGLQGIILDTMAATEKGGTIKGQKVNQTEMLQKLLPNKRSFLALQEFVNVFRGAGGGEKGLDAIRAEFQKFSGGTLAKSKIDEDWKNAFDTGSGQMESFNTAIGDIVDSVWPQFRDAIIENKGHLMELAGALGDLATWVVENPKKAIAGGIILSIGRAGLETVFRSSLERAILGSSGAIGTGAAAGMKGALIGASGTIAAAAAAAIAVAIGQKVETDRRLKELTDTQTANDKIRSDAEAAIASGDPTKIAEAKSKTQRALDSVTAGAQLRETRGMNLMMGMPAAAGGMSSTIIGQEATELGVLRAEMTSLKSVMTKMSAQLGGTLKVNVTNPPPAKQLPQ